MVSASVTLTADNERVFINKTDHLFQSTACPHIAISSTPALPPLSLIHMDESYVVPNLLHGCVQDFQACLAAWAGNLSLSCCRFQVVVTKQVHAKLCHPKLPKKVGRSCSAQTAQNVWNLGNPGKPGNSSGSSKSVLYQMGILRHEVLGGARPTPRGRLERLRSLHLLPFLPHLVGRGSCRR